MQDKNNRENTSEMLRMTTKGQLFPSMLDLQCNNHSIDFVNHE